MQGVTSARGIGAGLLFLLLAATQPGTAHTGLSLNDGKASETLLEYSRKSHIQVLFRSEDVENQRTQSVDGTVEDHRALARMLETTSLEYYFLNPYTAIVRPRRKPLMTEQESEITIRGLIHPERPPLGPVTFQQTPQEVPGVGLVSLPGVMQQYTQVGSTCDDALQTTRASRSNSARACSLDWRRVGTSATLVLVDGLRLPVSGTAGVLTDLTQVPTSAVEDFEITPDMPSLLYGADAIAGVINFHLRQTFRGSETRLVSIPGIGGAASETKLTQLAGIHVGELFGVAAAEYTHRDALPSNHRAEGTSNLRNFGGGDYSTAFGDPGNVVLPSKFYAIPSLPAGLALTAEDFIPNTLNEYNTRASTNLSPREDIWSGYISGGENMDGTELHANGVLTYRITQDYNSAVALSLPVPQTNAFYLAPQNISGPETVEFSTLRVLGPSTLMDRVLNGHFAIGSEFEPATGIHVCTKASYGFEFVTETVGNVPNPIKLATAIASPDPLQAVDPYQSQRTSAVWNSIRGESHNDSISAVTQLNVMADGGTQIHRRGAKYTVGLEWRRESFESTALAAGSTSGLQTSGARSVWAAFGTLCMPLIAPELRVCGDNEDTRSRPLDLIVGGRLDRYDEVGSLATPAITLVWQASPSLTFSVSGGLPRAVASLSDLNEAHSTSVPALLRDPSAASGYTQTLVASGGKADVRPEKGRNATLTMRWLPRWSDQLSIGIHAFYIDVRNRIDAPDYSTNALGDVSLRNVVTWLPTLEQLRLVCEHTQYPLGEEACLNSAPGAILDIRVTNLNRVTTDGVDFDLEKVWATARGRLSVRLQETYVDRYVVEQGGIRQERVNTLGNALRERATAAALWQRDAFSITASATYAGGYHDSSQLRPDIRSWLTFDFQWGWRWSGGEAGILSNVELIFGVHNLFGVTAPFSDNPAGIGFDPSNANQLGRLFMVQVAKHL